MLMDISNFKYGYMSKLVTMYGEDAMSKCDMYMCIGNYFTGIISTRCVTVLGGHCYYLTPCIISTRFVTVFVVIISILLLLLFYMICYCIVWSLLVPALSRPSLKTVEIT